MTRILGIDPGIHGGCAIVMVHDGAKPEVVDIIDIPVVGIGGRSGSMCSRSVPGSYNTSPITP